jgi:hypothetical protein
VITTLLTLFAPPSVITTLLTLFAPPLVITTFDVTLETTFAIGGGGGGGKVGGGGKTGTAIGVID